MGLVEEIADFLVENGGPVDGRAHPTRQRLNCSDLEAAITLAESQGLPQGMKPYHVKDTKGIWVKPQYLNEVLIKKIDKLLETNYEGDLVALITKVTAKDLHTSLTDQFQDRPLQVTMAGIGGVFGGSPFLMITRYIEAKGLQKEYRDLKPYHFKMTSWGTFKDEAVVNGLLIKKIDQLLQQKYGGSLVSLIAKTSNKQLCSPYEDTLNGKPISVSMGTIYCKLGNSPFSMVSRYIKEKGLEKDYSDLRPYHFKVTTKGTFDDVAVINEVLMKKVDHLLEHSFNDLVDLITNVRAKQLLSPLEDTLNKQKISVSMARVGNKFSDSPYKMLSRYIELKELQKTYPLKPYHLIVAPQRSYENTDLTDKLILKKIDQVLKRNYDGDLVSLITNVGISEVLSPFEDKLGGQKVEVSMRATRALYEGSPFLIISRYIELKKLGKAFSDLKPYHCKITPQNTFDDEAIVEEMLVKKIDQVLERNYGGDLVALITQSTHNELLSPFDDVLNNRLVSVSVATLERKIGSSPFLLVSRYIKKKDLEKEYCDLKPYHFKQTPRSAYKGQSTADDLLVKKIDQTLERKYDGDLGALIVATNQQELLSPFDDVLHGQHVDVSMGVIGHKFGESPFLLISRYIEKKELSDKFGSLRPYHFKMAAIGTYDDQTVVEEVLVKKIDQVLEQEFEGDLFTLITNVYAENLLSPFKDDLNGQQVSVSMGAVSHKFESSPFLMVSRYIELKELQDEFSGIRPYHLKQSSKKSMEDKKIAAELLVKKVEQVYEKGGFEDMTHFISHVSSKDLFSPYEDKLNGKPVNVSINALARTFGSSPFLMMKRYFSLKKKLFSYTKSCFLGPYATRARRVSGNFNKSDLEKIRNNSDLNTSEYGFRSFNSEDKDVTRELIAESYIDRLGDADLKYLGLESETFSSLSWFAEMLNYDADNSTVIERNSRVYRAMKAIQQYSTKELKRTLRGLDIRNGDFFKELRRLKHPYNLVNFDTVGHYCKSKDEALTKLFSQGLLDPQAMIFVTLDNSGLGKNRAERAGFSNQIQAVNATVLSSATVHSYTAHPEFQLEYVGGTNGHKREMVVLGYYVEAKTSE